MKAFQVWLEDNDHSKFKATAARAQLSMRSLFLKWIESGGPECAGKPSVEALERHYDGLAEGKAKGVKTPPVVVSEPVKPTAEEVEKKQRSCKHFFVPGDRTCTKCGWVPPVPY